MRFSLALAAFANVALAVTLQEGAVNACGGPLDFNTSLNTEASYNKRKSVATCRVNASNILQQSRLVAVEAWFKSVDAANISAADLATATKKYKVQMTRVEAARKLKTD